MKTLFIFFLTIAIFNSMQCSTWVFNNAIHYNNIQKIQEYLNNGYQPSARQINNVARLGYSEIMKLFIQYKINIDQADDWTPLMEAANEWNFAMVQLLLNQGARINFESTKTSLATGKKLSPIKDSPILCAASTLLNACKHNQPVIELLLLRGATIPKKISFKSLPKDPESILMHQNYEASLRGIAQAQINVDHKKRVLKFAAFLKKKTNYAQFLPNDIQAIIYSFMTSPAKHYNKQIIYEEERKKERQRELKLANMDTLDRSRYLTGLMA